MQRNDDAVVQNYKTYEYPNEAKQIVRKNKKLVFTHFKTPFKFYLCIFIKLYILIYMPLT